MLTGARSRGQLCRTRVPHLGHISPSGGARARIGHPVTGPEAAANDAPSVPTRLVFRIPRTSLIAVLAVMVFAIPFASGWPPLWLVYLVPLAVAYVLLRLRTVADTERIVVRGLFSTRTLEWSQLTSLRVSERAWVRAVIGSEEVTLPSVRARHLPALALVSGGRLEDPVPDGDR